MLTTLLSVDNGSGRKHLLLMGSNITLLELRASASAKFDIVRGKESENLEVEMRK